MRIRLITAVGCLGLVAMACTGASSTQTTAETEPTTSGSVSSEAVLIATGVYEGSDKKWTMTAFEDADGSICLQIGGTSCVHLEGDVLGIVPILTTDAVDDEACGFGAVSGATYVEVTQRSGAVAHVQVNSHSDFDFDFFGFCGTGDLQPIHVELPSDS